MNNAQERLHPSIAMFASPHGTFVRWPEGGFATGPWNYTSIRNPVEPPVNEWLVAQLTETSNPEIMRWTGTAWALANGTRRSQPRRWAELAMTEPVTAEDPGGRQPLSDPSLLQEIVNLAFRFWKRNDVLDKADRSPYNNPNEGAPEE